MTVIGLDQCDVVTDEWNDMGKMELNTCTRYLIITNANITKTAQPSIIVNIIE